MAQPLDSRKGIAKWSGCREAARESAICSASEDTRRRARQHVGQSAGGSITIDTMLTPVLDIFGQLPDFGEGVFKQFAH